MRITLIVSMRITLIVFICILILTPSLGLATISFDANGKWETTFDYSQECDQRGEHLAFDCDDVENDGILWTSGDHHNIPAYSTRAVTAANNPIGGGLGYRSYVATGDNVQNGFVSIPFPTPQKEFWFRWYMKYEDGFPWSSFQYQKFHWIRSSDNQWIVAEYDETGGNDILTVNAFGSNVAQNTGTPYGLSDVMTTEPPGTHTGDGEWNCIEVYYKIDTDTTNGVTRVWINGTLRLEGTGLNLSRGNSIVQDGISRIEFPGNQRTVGGSSFVGNVDYDNLVVYNQTPQNDCDDGEGGTDPCIGPITAPSTETTATSIEANSVVIK